MTAISVIGAGYVGLVTGVGLADIGHDVVCVDKDLSRLAEIAAGRVPFHEPGLRDLLERNLGLGFSVTDDLEQAVSSTTVTFLAVGTPSGPDGIDLTHVEAACEEIGQALAAKVDHHVVVVKSTVVPGTTDGLVARTLERSSGRVAGRDFSVTSNPEFLTEGRAVIDFFEPDRIVVGVDDPVAETALREIYLPFGSTPLIVTNARTAEMIKYASNALLATMISFTNEIANLGAAIGGIDTTDVMRGVHLSRYLTNRRGSEMVVAELASFLEAGCGFGGSCLPKDVAALSAHAQRVGSGHAVLDAVLDTNRHQPLRLVEIVEHALGSVAHRTVAVLGLAFKPDTSDVRETPAVPVIRALLERGAKVVVHDPVVRAADLPSPISTQVIEEADLFAAVNSADALVLVTKWDEYRAIPGMIGDLEHPPVFVDGRRFLDPDSVPVYAGIGR